MADALPEMSAESTDHPVDDVRNGGTDDVLRRVAAAAAGVPGLGVATIWGLRPDDETYVEIARAGGGAAPDAELTPPPTARRAGALCDWANGLPRWAGLAWVPADRTWLAALRRALGG